MLNAYPHPTIAFEPPPGLEAGRVLLTNQRAEEILGFSEIEASRLTLRHFISFEGTSLLEEGLRQLVAGKSAFLDAAKVRTKAGLTVDGRVTLAPLHWGSKPLGLCVLQDAETCRKILAAVERPGETDRPAGPLEYPSSVNLNTDIRNPDSKLYRRLMIPVDKVPVVEARITRSQTSALLKNTSHVKAMVDLLNMYSNKMGIPDRKRLLIVCAEEGGGWMDLADLVREENVFQPRATNSAVNEAS